MKKHLTLDRSGVNIVHTVEQIGPKRHKTPEGFLLCLDVPLARIGTMFYGPGETPISAGRDNIARVTRDAATLFAKDTIASFNGKPVVNEHPPVDVNARNWKQYSVGVCMNVRQGTADEADVILGDLLITDAATIRDVETGKREVSAGYEADYQQTGEGEGRQTNIIGNHIALVERGRCGPRCAIGDHQPTKELSTMGTQTKSASPPVERRPLPPAIRKLFKDTMEELAGVASEAADADLGGAADADTDTGPAGGGDSHTHIHIHQGGAAPADAAPAGGDMGLGDDMGSMDADPAGGGDLESRIAALESNVAMLMDMLGGDAGGGEGDDLPGDDGGDMPADAGGDPNPEPAPTKDRASVGDSVALEASFRALVTDIEILVPGYRLPTFDAAATRASTIDRMCATRRGVLGHLASTLDGQRLLQSVSDGDLDVEKASCADVAVVFKAAAGAQRMLNNNNMTRDAGKPGNASVTMPGAVGGVMSIAQLNAQHAAYWAAQNKTAAK